MSPFRDLLLFALLVLALVALSRWVGLQVQVLVLRLTGSEQAAHMAYYLLFLPGIALHELSHVVMASLLGLKVGSVSLGPRRRNKTSIELGSVTIRRGDAIRESLVGLAPFLAGTAALTLICYYVFDIGGMAEALSADGWDAALRDLAGFWRVPDFGIWAYFIFVVSNAMMPSPSDRRPWLLAGLYLALALGIFFLVAGIPVVPDGLRYTAAALLQALTLAFLFTLLVDLAAAALLWAADLIVAALRRR